MVAAVWARQSGRVGLVILAVLMVAAVVGVLLPAAPIDLVGRFAPPGVHHPLGTDALGRDLLWRVAQGAAVALPVALVTVGLALVIGAGLGMMSARAPAIVSGMVLILFDGLGAFPTLLLALAAVALLGPGLGVLIVVIGASLVPQFGRVARAQTLVVRSAPFMEAARASGASELRLLVWQIAPNIAARMLILACLNLPGVIAIEAGLSFLGVGIPPPAPSWGGLLFEAYVHLDRSPWGVIAASLALILATLGFTLVGEALRRGLGLERDDE